MIKTFIITTIFAIFWASTQKARIEKWNNEAMQARRIQKTAYGLLSVVMKKPITGNAKKTFCDGGAYRQKYARAQAKASLRVYPFDFIFKISG